MSEKLVVAVLHGTTRKGNKSDNAARWVAEQLKEREELEVIFVEPAGLNLPVDGDNEDERDPRYTEITAKADAFFIVTPEYNRGYPPSLKRMLDSEYDNYKHKPVALAGVSSGPWGGRAVTELLLPTLHTLWLVPIQPTMYFPKIADTFDEAGHMKAELVERYEKSLKSSADELIWMAKTLKAGRSSA
jgi:NAD(P)H-dependent FMN reductase